MKPLRSVQAPPSHVPQVIGNGVVLSVAQYSCGTGAARRVSSPDPSAVPIAEVPADGDTITFVLATTVRPSLMSISAYSRVQSDGTPVPASETAFDCEKLSDCDISDDGHEVKVSITAQGAKMVTLRTAFDVPSDTSDTGLDEPFTASWVLRLLPT